MSMQEDVIVVFLEKRGNVIVWKQLDWCLYQKAHISSHPVGPEKKIVESEKIINGDLY